jgi:hypothetical protein
LKAVEHQGRCNRQDDIDEEAAVGFEAKNAGGNTEQGRGKTLEI